MKILGRVESEAVTDIRCDVCDESARVASGNLQYGTLEAHWGYGSAHDGERYEVHLCERCFFTTLAFVKQERRTSHLFNSDPRSTEDELGLISKSDLFRDGG
ncbi:hypothetical protein C4K06_6159 [Pseudomonas chlororaphis subsp. aureofaciens]|uniref:hypothetical protein n=1 Tax=Pseudomonas chlororaphis TaxID=587753 RepID=UPI000F567036|nr:hypothetical protein [Pseudomonas chlororaphis]AZE39147.1 hypothetical protein C4K06_6159 [Pseudomonas chlororaphis subsp. aureofaciens]